MLRSEAICVKVVLEKGSALPHERGRVGQDGRRQKPGQLVVRQNTAHTNGAFRAMANAPQSEHGRRWGVRLMGILRGNIIALAYGPLFHKRHTNPLRLKGLVQAVQKLPFHSSCHRILLG